MKHFDRKDFDELDEWDGWDTSVLGNPKEMREIKILILRVDEGYTYFIDDQEGDSTFLNIEDVLIELKEIVESLCQQEYRMPAIFNYGKF